MCTVLLPLGVYPILVNKYIIISYHPIISATYCNTVLYSYSIITQTWEICYVYRVTFSLQIRTRKPFTTIVFWDVTQWHSDTGYVGNIRSDIVEKPADWMVKSAGSTETSEHMCQITRWLSSQLLTAEPQVWLIFILQQNKKIISYIFVFLTLSSLAIITCTTRFNIK